jgi:hypothetical protein
MNHIIVFVVLLILIVISILYYYSYNNNIKNHIKENFESTESFQYLNSLLLSTNKVMTAIYDSINNCNYYASTDGTIMKVTLNTFTEIEKIILSKVEGIMSGFINKNSTYLYLLTNSQPAMIVRVDLNNFKKEAVKYGVLPPTYDNVRFSLIDSNSQFGYFLSTSSYDTKNKYILKVDLVNFEYNDNLDNIQYYTTKHNNPETASFSYYKPSNNDKIKVGLVNPRLTIIPSSFMMDKFEQNLYIGTDKGILKYDLTNPNAFMKIPIYAKIFRAGTTTSYFNNDPNNLYFTEAPIISSTIDNNNMYGFFVTDKSKLLKIKLDSFDITTIDLNGITGTKNIRIDNVNSYLYGDSNNGKLFRLDLNSNEIKDINISGKTVLNNGITIDKENKFLYIVSTESSSYVLKIKLKNERTIPTEEAQTSELETSYENKVTKSKPNVKIDEINNIQTSINSILDTQSIERIIPTLSEIDSKMNNVLKEQINDHKDIIDSMNLTITELTNTKNIIDQERAKANLTNDEPYLIKALPIPPTQPTPLPTQTISESFINQNEPRAFDPLVSKHDIKELENNTQRKQMKMNKQVFNQPMISPRINDLVNLEPDWKIEWIKSIQNANMNQLLVLP